MNRQIDASSPYRLGSGTRLDEPTAISRSSRSVGSGGVFRLPTAAGSSIDGQGVLAAGSRYLGTRYEMGGGRGSGQVRSIDCSAFVSRAYSDATGGRVKLTPYTDAMAEETVAISPAEARPGDLVFYRGSDPDQPGTQYPHVALYAGSGRVLDASSAVGCVAYHQIGLGPGYTPEFRRVKGT